MGNKEERLRKKLERRWKKNPPQSQKNQGPPMQGQPVQGPPMQGPPMQGQPGQVLEAYSPRMWQRSPAGKELCRGIGFKLGFWLRFLEYLTPPEQASLQLMGRYSYNIGVARAMKPFPIRSLFFPAGNQIFKVTPWNKVNVLEAGINSGGWCFIPIGSNIFQVKNDNSKTTRLLEKTGSSRFRVISKAPMNQARTGASFCNLAERFIFVTGGKNNNEVQLRSVERYDITKDIWEEMPQMNVTRQLHSSCALGTAVYVLCGLTPVRDLMNFNSIEKLETLDLQAGWQLIQMPPLSLHTQRFRPVVTAFNENEILVMGGLKLDKLLADALTFDTRTNSFKVVVQGAPFKFCGAGKDCIQVRRGSIFALVSTSDYKMMVIEYKNGQFKSLYRE